MPNSHTLDQNLQRLITTRTSIADAIVQKGGTVSQGDGFEDFPDDIASITNTYAASDEGKVVSNGALVSQGSDTVTQNGTIDTTLISELVVDVESGGSIPDSWNYTKPDYAFGTEKVYDRIWTTKTWTGLTSFTGNYIWTDGSNIYYSGGTSSTQYVLDKETSTWTTKTWIGLTNLNGEYIWTDGTDIYYTDNSAHYILDKSTSTWNTKIWTGLTSFNVKNIWTDGDSIYYSGGGSSNQYVLNKETSTWTTKTWTGLTSFTGNYIWTDGSNIYCTRNSSDGTYILDKETSSWSSFASSNVLGNTVWTDGKNVYGHYKNNSYNYPRVYNKASSTWKEISWKGISKPVASLIWADGDNIYYSDGSSQCVLTIIEATFTNTIPTVRVIPRFS